MRLSNRFTLPVSDELGDIRDDVKLVPYTNASIWRHSSTNMIAEDLIANGWSAKSHKVWMEFGIVRCR